MNERETHAESGQIALNAQSPFHSNMASLSKAKGEGLQWYPQSFYETTAAFLLGGVVGERRMKRMKKWFMIL